MGQNESKTSWIGAAVLGGIVVALLFPPTLAAQGGLILSNGLNPTSLYRLDLLSPGVNEGRFLFDFTLSPIVHAITICPGSQVVLGIGATPPVITRVDLSAPVPTEELVGFLPDAFEFAVFQLACSLDNEFFFTNLLNEGLYTINPDTECVGTPPDVLCTPTLVGIIQTSAGEIVDTHGADIEFTEDGTLYLLANHPSAAAGIRDFYEIDPANAIATLIKEDVTEDNNTGLGETLDGRLISSNVDDNLYQLDPASGDATALGTISVVNVSPGPFVLDLDGGDLAGRAPAGTIIIEKQTNPDGSAQSFEFVPSWKENFTLVDDEVDISLDLLASTEVGPYAVSEVVPPGWEQTSVVCDDGSDPSAIDLGFGETVTCVFTNTIQPGTIIVEKQTDPNGSTQSFEFVPSWKGNFSLTDGQQDISDDLLPSSEGGSPYSVTEILPPGWILTSATCDDGSSPTAIDLGAGETVTCGFFNFLERGTIIVEKQTDPDGSPQSFEFVPSWKGNFSLTDGEQDISAGLLPSSSNRFSRVRGGGQPSNGGLYSVGEIVPDGWELTSSVCSDGSDPSAISLSPAETVTCIFTNTFVPPPGEFRCRTPGFWGTHACPGNPESCEKSKSQNITGALIDSAGGLTVCGQPIDNTLVDWQNSALEAICMHPRGVIEHQLVRQLTALALNCELSGFGADCSLNPALGALFASCDAICQSGGDLSGCISDIDCSNNGGSLFGGVCVFGECSETGELCGFDLTLDCPYVDDGLLGNLNKCTAFDDNCHDRSLCPDLDDDGVVNGSDFCFEPPGPAGSPKACNQARRSDCTVLIADCAVNNNG